MTTVAYRVTYVTHRYKKQIHMENMQLKKIGLLGFYSTCIITFLRSTKLADFQDFPRWRKPLTTMGMMLDTKLAWPGNVSINKRNYRLTQSIFRATFISVSKDTPFKDL